MKKRGQVLRFEVEPTTTGWIITSHHRTANGGIESVVSKHAKFAGVPAVSEHAKFASVLARLNNIVDTCGVER